MPVVIAMVLVFFTWLGGMEGAMGTVVECMLTVVRETCVKKSNFPEHQKISLSRTLLSLGYRIP